ncbi:MAG TPA: hypothetical protein PKY05_19865, partial [Fibrobacteria bacterium]|nr:hypothetical protein [Fibrobacteria bacterium]
MRLLLSACEESGDRIAARLAPHLADLLEGAHLAGSCGRAMEAAGVERLARAEAFSHVGWASVVRSLPHLAWSLWRYVRAVDAFRPRAAVLVDAPGVHRMLIRRLALRGVRTVWVAPPQLWAWRGRKLTGLEGLRAHPLHGFEEDSLRDCGLDAQWLGYPGGEAPAGEMDRDLLVLLPGSRPHWRRIHRELFARTAAGLDVPLRAVFVHPHSRGAEEGLECLTPEEAFPRAALALAMPGTGALELARRGVPTVLAARPGRLDAHLARRRLDPGFKGLPNRILGREVFPERFATDLSEQELTPVLADLWERREETRERLAGLEGLLWAQGA